MLYVEETGRKEETHLQPPGPCKKRGGGEGCPGKAPEGEQEGSDWLSVA
jgi:hypothetical protein